MKLQQALTKDNFWNKVMELYPKATKNFCAWIDEYKIAVGWDFLFFNNRKASPKSKCRSSNIEFHDIPFAMQEGIWLEYCRQTLHKYFEQPEHISDSFDLEEDIKNVFEEIELCN